MGRRRFGPLIAVVVAATALVLGRLFQVQILEHAVWAEEAANLVRSGAIVPYARGEIVDRRGRVLARDEEVYRVEFRYRDFRRGHPLGQVAHAWSALTLRPVPLDEVFERLPEVARDLVQLEHGELDAFARGKPLERGLLQVPGAEDAGAELRLGRRADVRFYVGRLLGLDRGDALRALRDESSPSLFDYAARVRGMTGDELLADLDHRLATARADLERLAILLADAQLRGVELEGARSPERDLLALVERLEEWRAAVEDATAAELFREAAGFSAGRVAPHTLDKRFELDWLASLLRWDAERVRSWAVDARQGWWLALVEWRLERLRHEIEFAARDRSVPSAVIGGWTSLYLADADGERPATRPLVVFSELDTLFDGRTPRRLRVSGQLVLPVQDPRLAPAEPGFADVARLELWTPEGRPDPEDVERLAAQWSEHFAGRTDADWAVERSHERLLDWEDRLQIELAAQLDRLAEEAGCERLRVSEARLDRAEERARSVLKDRGSRPVQVVRKPDYGLIHLLTRYPDRFAGFVVRESTERKRLADERGVIVLGPLLGTVRAPALRELMAEREPAEALAWLIGRGRRNAEEDDELRVLVQQVTRVDELLGGDGIEGHFDRELSGRNGYREQRGLREIRAGETSMDIPPQDGERLVLTLDLDLQRAAFECLTHPAEDPDAGRRDYTWLDRPTGAIVLARVDGDVLAAASVPDRGRGPEAGREMRDRALERTLRRPGFQPAGSVFKPFVAAWALDHVELDPNEEVGCFLLQSGSGAGYKTLRCWKEWGHGNVALGDALSHSCNGYFAWLGEQLETEDFRGLTAAFGFGQPTGVRVHPRRGGLREDSVPALLSRELRGRELLMAGNGLGVIEVTPLQVARAYAGLATGLLPEMRLVESVGGEPLPHRSRPVGLSRAALEHVRAALWNVTNDEGGTAHAALGVDEIGLRMSAKTGSADISSIRVRAADGKLRVPKHTWVAGWFPPEDPALVVVVFVQDTLATSGHSSTWIARDFLRRPEVRTFLEEELAAR